MAGQGFFVQSSTSTGNVAIEVCWPNVRSLDGYAPDTPWLRLVGDVS